jgi:hypothetical protein
MMKNVVRWGFAVLIVLVSYAEGQAQNPVTSVSHPSKDELAGFLVKAKRATYASQGDVDSVKNVLLPGTHQLEYSEGLFLYRDIYAGSAMFAGQEMVYYSGKPIWAMSYAGDIPEEVSSQDIEGLVKLLHKALMNVPDTIPYRGPTQIEDGAFRYANHAGGSFASFFGDENIQRAGRVLYTLHYEGGLLR